MYSLKASAKLTALRDSGLLILKGKGSATYYVPGPDFIILQDSALATHNCVPTMPDNGPAMSNNDVRLQDNDVRLQDSGASLQGNKLIQEALRPLKRRMKQSVLDKIIIDLCKIKAFERAEVARLIHRDETYVRTFLTRLVKDGKLRMTYQEMPNHPHQSYYAAGKENG